MVADDALPAPVARLLELGEPKYARDFAWPDYRGKGTIGFRPVLAISLP